MFMATLCIIAKNWKQPRCPSTGDWIKQAVALSSGKESPSDTKHNLDESQGIMLSEKSQSQNLMYHIILFL